MKHIIIISYFFPPRNQVGARRAYYFSKHFNALGYEVTVITSELPADYPLWNASIADFNVIRLPIVNGNFIKKFPNNRIIRFINSFLSPLEADNKILIKDIDFNAIANPDFIIATGGPWHTFELGVAIKKHFTNSKLIFDYRDAWTLVDKKVGLEALSGFGNGIGKLKEIRIKRKEKKLLAFPDAVISVTEPLLKNVIRIANRKTDLKYTTIYNGFDDYFPKESSEQGEFKIVYPGNIRKEQELQVFLDGYELFLQNELVDKKLVRCYFVGCDKPKLQKLLVPFKRFSFSENLAVTKLVDYAVSLKYQLEATVLLHFGFTGKSGIMSGKIFEYLAMQKNILLVSKENDVLEKLVKKTNTGLVINNKVAVSDALLMWYKEFVSKRELDFRPKPELIRFYKMENQVKILNQFLKEL